MSQVNVEGDEDELDREENVRSGHIWQGHTDVRPRGFPSLGHVSVVKVSLGSGHCALLTREQHLYMFGRNNCGQLGCGDKQDRPVEPVLLQRLSECGIRDVACGHSHTAAVGMQGSVYCWGEAAQGQCGVHLADGQTCLLTPHKVNFISEEEVSPIHTSPLLPRKEPQQPPCFCKVSCSESHTAAVTVDGELWVWGQGMKMGLQTEQACMLPHKIEYLDGRNVTQVECGRHHIVVLTHKLQNTQKNNRLSTNRQKQPETANGSNPKKPDHEVAEDKLNDSKKEQDKNTCKHCNQKKYHFTERDDMLIVNNACKCEQEPKGDSVSSHEDTLPLLGDGMHMDKIPAEPKASSATCQSQPNVTGSKEDHCDIPDLVRKSAVLVQNGSAVVTCKVCSPTASQAEPSNVNDSPGSGQCNTCRCLDLCTNAKASSQISTVGTDAGQSAQSEDIPEKSICHAYVAPEGIELGIRDLKPECNGTDAGKSQQVSVKGASGESTTDQGVTCITSSNSNVQDESTFITAESPSSDSAMSESQVSLGKDTSDKSVLSPDSEVKERSLSDPQMPNKVPKTETVLCDMKRPYSPHRSSKLSLNIDEANARDFLEKQLGSPTSPKSVSEKKSKSSAVPEMKKEDVPQSPLMKTMGSWFRYIPTDTGAMHDYVSGLTNAMVTNFKTTVNRLKSTGSEEEEEGHQLSDLACSSDHSIASSESAMFGKDLASSVPTTLTESEEHAIRRTQSMAMVNREGSRKGRKTHERQASLPGRSKGSHEKQLDSLTQLDGPNLDTEVWTWGVGSSGQLGQGDLLDRLHPCCVKKLSDKEVVKVVAGANFCAALTSQSQVYMWGSNEGGQLIGEERQVLAPKLVQLPNRLLTFDLAAGDSHCTFLVDATVPEVYISGIQLGISRSTGAAEDSDLKQFERVVFLEDPGFMQQVFSGSSWSGSLCIHGNTAQVAAVHDFTSSERRFLRRLLNISNLFLVPFQQSVMTSSEIVQQMETASKEGPTLKLMLDAFQHLMKRVTTNVWHLTAVTQGLARLEQIQLLASQEKYMASYQHYIRCYENGLAVGIFEYASKQASTFFQKNAKVLEQLQPGGHFDKKNMAANFRRLMQVPLAKVKDYCNHLSSLLSTVSENSLAHSLLRRSCEAWENLKKNSSKEHSVAESTRLFWASCPRRLATSLCSPGRRLVRESRTHPLNLPTAGRFSVHWFLLFNDVFVHGHNSMHQAFPLSTVWVEPLPDTDHLKNAIRLVMPEETLTLTTPDTSGKAEWLWALNETIYKCVSDLKGSEGLKAGVLRVAPPRTRQGIHVFYKPGALKDARYMGMWTNGQMNGQGSLTWPDGRKYEGSFKASQMDGEGTMVFPGDGHEEIHKGTWKDGQLHGYGTIRYSSGDMYEGYFMCGLRHGHGLLRQGQFVSSIASIYLGGWRDDKRDGYGVLDDIQKGQKYMGMWQDDLHHGNGIIVTLDGMYFEGNFSQDKITGVGLLLTEDDTCYEGEFAGGPTLQGKGKMTLPNGDYMEGHFSGTFSDGIKIQGTFHKGTEADSPVKESNMHDLLGRFAVPAAQKWNEIFDNCLHELGCNQSSQGVDHAKAWENVSILVAVGKKAAQKENLAIPGNRPSNTDVLERIPPWQQETLTLQGYRQIRQYLTKAFDTSYHPLGRLVDSLTNMYRATYVGVGAHPRLLKHSVEEIKSYILRVYRIVRILFPVLPPSSQTVEVFQEEPTTARNSEGEEEEDSEIVTPGELLHPLILPRVYPPLFMLYALYNEHEDEQYWRRLQLWNKQSDIGLMTYLGLDDKFWLVKAPTSTEETGHPKLGSIKDRSYVIAIETLQQISTSFSPAEKLWLIQKTFNEVNKQVQSCLPKDHLWCMDDLFPVFQYVVVRARIRHLGAEIHFIEDLMERHLEHGELGIMFTTLKACYFQIQTEKPHI